MRTRATILISIALAMSVAAPVAAGGSQTFHFSEKGQGADAYWTTYPIDGIAVTNVVYRDTFVGASSSIVKADGTTFSNGGLFVDSFTYKFDRRGNFVPISETFGFVDGASVIVDSKLANASVAGSGPADYCAYDANWNATCSSTTFSFSGTWTGQGPLYRTHGTGSFGVSGTYQVTYHGTGSWRAATAAASLTIGSGTVSVGQNQFADLFASRNGENDVIICHNGC